MAEDYPKVVEHPNGDRLTVQNLIEQDEATRKGYLRSIARNREFAATKAAAKAGEVTEN